MKRLVKQKAPTRPKQLAVGQVWSQHNHWGEPTKWVIAVIDKSRSGRYTDVWLATLEEAKHAIADSDKMACSVLMSKSAFRKRWKWIYVGEFSQQLDEGECV